MNFLALTLNEANIYVEGFAGTGGYSAALQSPKTHSRPADTATVQAALKIFGYEQQDLDSNIPPAFANGGANHLVISLNSRYKLVTAAGISAGIDMSLHLVSRVANNKLAQLTAKQMEFNWTIDS